MESDYTLIVDKSINFTVLSLRSLLTLTNLYVSVFLAIMPYVWSEFLILLYNCNFQVRSCRLICDLRVLLVFIWLRCETALVPYMGITYKPESCSFGHSSGIKSHDSHVTNYFSNFCLTLERN